MTMLYIHPNNHIRFCVYQNEVIILDLNSDRYIFLQNQDSDLFLYLLSQPFIKTDIGNYKNISDNPLFDDTRVTQAISDLRKSHIVSEKDFSKKYNKVIFHADQGMPNIDWNLTNNLASKTKIKYMINSYIILLNIFITIKIKGFYHLINKICHNEIIKSEEKEDIKNLAIALNKACSLFPVRVKCLEWSLALYFLARKYNLTCNFVIGVQNYPFKAHAWIEYKNSIVADSPELGKSLAIILNEPGY